ncbi:ATP-binding cassette domain-containing protein [Kineosporia sp. R_H_3]|uniref:ATP-binding cassette domain-containing protein n=1 Tax=Kineosporia sp. R_H_3 TaxID=1961848 RepID=UPI000B4AD748|nr:ATP-binding cassette domain-containing protein [Kineosporia sp. R_H_3]
MSRARPPATAGTTAGTTGPAVSAADLVKTYRTGRRTPEVRALDGLTVDIPAGAVFGLLGPNGAGKSTTVRILTTLSRPDSGRAVVAGVDVTRRPDAVRRLVGLVSQRSSADPLATGRENLVLAGRVQGLQRADAVARARDLLERLDLTDAADRLVRTWSGGMSRRLDVAIGLVHRPSVLFLDEPTTGLDPDARSRMWAEIARLSGQEEVTVVLTTHHLEEADRLAHRLAVVDRGRLVVEGSPEELKRDLRGDTVHLELGSPDDARRALGLLAAVPGLRDLTADGALLRARADDGARVVPQVLAALDTGGLQAAAVSVARPTLDDVYRRHTGRAYAAAGTEVAA